MRITRNENGIELCGEKLCIRLDQSQGAIYLSRIDGSVKIGPALFWSGFEPKPGDKKFLFSTIIFPGEPELSENQPTPIGTATMVRWPVALCGCRFIWEIACFENEDYAAFRLRMQNRNRETARVFELSPFSYRGAGDGLEMGAGYTVWKFYRLGYQSWSPSAAIDFLEPQPKPRNFLARAIAQAPFLKNRRYPWVWSSEWMAEIVEPELDAAMLLGFITAKAQNSVVEAEVRFERFRRFEAVADCEAAELPPGEELSSDWAIAMLTDAPRAGQKKYFELCARAMGARSTKPVQGWCSWYYYFEKIDQAGLEENLEQLSKLNPRVQLFQIDDGWQTAIGDWLNWNYKFPGGPKALADKIHGRGLKAGIWLAPFLASGSSELYDQHRDWFLKSESGKTVTAMINPRWKGFFAYALDATHPGFLEWLAAVVRKLTAEYGFDFLKLDVLYAAALSGKRHDPRATGASALRKGLEVIREAAGEDCYILGCGSPLLPAVGLVDAMRVSQDTDRRWKNPMDILFGLSLTPSLRSCLNNNLARALTAGRLWALDPDCLILSGEKLSGTELRSQLTLFYLLGGQMLLSEDLAALRKDQLDLFSLALPVSPRPAEPIDLFDRPFPQELFLPGQPLSLLALFNWSGEPKPAKINLLKYGLKKQSHLFEFWSREYLGELSGRGEFGKIEPRGVGYFAITEALDQPQIIGLDFHLGMGLGSAALGAGPPLKISIDLAGTRSGNVFLKLPGTKEIKVIPVAFENSLRMEI